MAKGFCVPCTMNAAGKIAKARLSRERKELDKFSRKGLTALYACIRIINRSRKIDKDNFNSMIKYINDVYYDCYPGNELPEKIKWYNDNLNEMLNKVTDVKKYTLTVQALEKMIEEVINDSNNILRHTKRRR